VGFLPDNGDNRRAHSRKDLIGSRTDVPLNQNGKKITYAFNEFLGH
jgi:hypothetical protein